MSLYYTIPRYILIEIHFLIASIQIGQQLVIPSAGQTLTKSSVIDELTHLHTFPDSRRTSLVCINYLRYSTLIESSPVFDMRPIGEGLIRGRYSLALIPFRSTPILKKLTGSLSQDFRWRDHVNRAFLSRPHTSAVQEILG